MLTFDEVHATLHKGSRTTTILSDGGLDEYDDLTLASASAVQTSSRLFDCSFKRVKTAAGQNSPPPQGTGVVPQGMGSNLFDQLLNFDPYEGQQDTDVGNLAALFSSSIGRNAVDLAEGQPCSPFAIAVANALARPGLSMKEFARLVRNEVEDMTGSAQTPQLIATPSGRARIVVTQRAISADDPEMRCVASG